MKIAKAVDIGKKARSPNIEHKGSLTSVKIVNCANIAERLDSVESVGRVERSERVEGVAGAERVNNLDCVECGECGKCGEWRVKILKGVERVQSGETRDSEATDDRATMIEQDDGQRGERRQFISMIWIRGVTRRVNTHC